MMYLAKRLACALVGAILLISPAAADPKADPAQTVSTSATPLGFGSQSPDNAAAAWVPVSVMFGLGIPLDNEQVTVPGVGRREGLFIGNNFSSGRFELAWALSRAARASPGRASPGRASASSSAFGALAPYLVLGVLARRDDIDAFTFSGGSVPTNGSSDFWGVYTGLNVQLLDTSTNNRSRGAPLHWTALVNLGYGEADVTAFNGAYSRSGKGEFYEVGTEMMFDVGKIYVGPALLYRQFNHNGIKAEEGVFEIRVNMPIMRR